MIISEILQIESANTGCINLFKEGIFWRIHQQSAYLFIKQIKNLKALKKFYKNVNREVIYAGFPDAILPQIQALSHSKGLKFEKHADSHRYTISGLPAIELFSPEAGAKFGSEGVLASVRTVRFFLIPARMNEFIRSGGFCYFFI